MNIKLLIYLSSIYLIINCNTCLSATFCRKNDELFIYRNNYICDVGFIQYDNQKIQISENKITTNFNQIKIQQLFEFLSQVIKSEFKVDDNIQDVITLKTADEPVDEFLEKFVNSNNLSIYVKNKKFYVKSYSLNELYKKKFEVYTKEASCGNDNSNYNLALMYINGEHVNTDVQKAIIILEKSAANKHALSLYQLGLIFLSKNKQYSDDKKAYNYIKKAAELNNIGAKYLLGSLYYIGRGVNKNINESLKWFESASDDNDSESTYALSTMYSRSDGIKTDINLAIKYLEKAANLKHEEAINELNRLKNNHNFEYLAKTYNIPFDGIKEITYTDTKDNLNKSFYIGQIRKGTSIKEGKGIAIYNAVDNFDKCYYEGDWYNDKYHGFGKYTCEVKNEKNDVVVSNVGSFDNGDQCGEWKINYIDRINKDSNELRTEKFKPCKTL